MATTSSAYTPTLNTLITALDPTAQWGNPANRLQIQNASPFTLEITCNGEQNTIQSFTAQTLTLDGAGTTVTMLPTSGPVGAQGSITAVWLQYQQPPPMADGQLTGAAQYAQGLGSTLFPTALVASGAANTVALPPTTRTVVVSATLLSGVFTLAPQIIVQGATSGIQYHINNAYLTSSLPGSQLWVAVVPITSTIDTSVTITVTGGVGANFGLSVYGDTAQYPESVLYNGRAGAFTYTRAVAGTTTILNGPARLLTVEVRSATNSVNAFILWDGAEILHANANATSQISSTLAFPPNTLLSAGSTLALNTFGAGVAAGTVVSAYP